MQKTAFVTYLPVIHRGYLEILREAAQQKVSLFLLAPDFVNSLSRYEPAMGYLAANDVQQLVYPMGITVVDVISNENDMKKLDGKEIWLVDDAVSRELHKRYFLNKKIEWKNVFLRWDQDSVKAEKDIPGSRVAGEHLAWMKEAYVEAEKSGDWWRQVGAVLVKDGRILLRSYNEGSPTDHDPYQLGGVRDYFEVGEKPEFSPTIHAEQLIVSEAAKRGISLEGSALYLTHFPCPVCAKLIARSGIRELYVSEGSANNLGLQDLELQKIDIYVVETLEG